MLYTLELRIFEQNKNIEHVLLVTYKNCVGETPRP